MHHDQPAGTLRGRLDDDVGAPRSQWTSDTLVDVFHDRALRIVSLLHVGGDGWPKTLDFVPRDDAHLRDILEGGERADGSSLFPGTGVPVGASDVVLRPRLGTAFVDPFAEIPTLTVLCGHDGRDGRPLPQSPDTIVHAAYERALRDTGVDLHALGEVEYFLGKHSEDVDVYGTTDRGYHATSPFVFGESLRRRALACLDDMGVAVKYGHSEVGYVEPLEGQGLIWEQHEIELALAPLPEAADAIVLTQWVVRNLAHRAGWRCSTAPVLMAGHAGNGLHIHVSPRIDGRHVGGRDESGDLWPPAKWLIAGMVRAAPALMAFGNRHSTSFLRLSQGVEVPHAVYWGDSDRNALIRLPLVSGAGSGRASSVPTVELRLSDGAALPHLLLAGIAQAVIDARALPDVDELVAQLADASNGAPAIPQGFGDVADALVDAREMLAAGGVFPLGLLDAVAAELRRREAGG